jgi:predicted aconitase with swiveling domain
MSHIFKGRAILAGDTNGEALVTHTGFNSLASFYKSMLTGANQAVCSDQDNKELFGKVLTDKIICLPKTIGSTSAGATWDKIAQMGIAPKAMLFSRHIDSLGAAGLIIAEVWSNKRIFVIDQLGEDFLEYVHNDQTVLIKMDGTVIVQ